MSYIHQIADDEAQGLTAELYAEARREHGRVLNLHRAFAHLPSFAHHFEAMTGALKARMGARRYELVTLAAALALRSSYCALAHAAVMMREGIGAGELVLIATDRAKADLTPLEREMMLYAEDIVTNAAALEAAHVEQLRRHGLGDAEISDIAAAAALRSFFSKFLDALGTQPDASYADLPQELRDALTVGREIDRSARLLA